MKKLSLMLVGILCIMLCSCGKKTTSAKRVKIGVLAPAVTHGWVAGAAFYAEQRCKELSAEGVQYKILTSSNAEEMTQQLDDLEAWNADAIVTYPQWTGMEVPITAVIERGTPVVSFDIAIAAKGVYLVSGDNEGMGRESAKYLISKLGNNATIAMLDVPSSGSIAALRMKGFRETAKEMAPNLKLIEAATKFTREDGLKDFADLLVAHKQIDGVFSMDDETSMGVLQAIREANRKDVKAVTGGGGCQEYFKLMSENKDIALQSALYSPAMIMDAVNAAYALAQGKRVEQSQIIPTTIVDATNCENYINASSPY